MSLNARPASGNRFHPARSAAGNFAWRADFATIASIAAQCAAARSIDRDGNSGADS